jgi:hypothetical protein
MVFKMLYLDVFTACIVGWTGRNLRSSFSRWSSALDVISFRLVDLLCFGALVYAEKTEFAVTSMRKTVRNELR